jgi:hypothetical protein
VRVEGKLTCVTGQDQWKNFQGEAGELPEEPFLIVVPPMLVEQAARECQRFLRGGSFDIIKITGSFEQHMDLWEEADERAQVPAHMRIYIATTTVSVKFTSHEGYSKRD